MSYRHHDVRLDQLIRNLEDRVRLLEQRDDTVRMNRLRIGNLTIEADPRPPGVPTSLKITNLSTGVVTLIPTP